MDQRTLQLIQRGLVAAVTVVLALVIVIAFVRVLEPTDAATAAPTSTTSTTSTTTPETTTTTTAPVDATTTTSGLVTPAVCAETQPPGDDVTVLRVFYPCGANDIATGQAYVYRAIPKTDLVLTATLRELVNGLDDGEAELGFRSPFPDEAQGAFLGASIEEGTAFLEFTTAVFPDGVDTPEGAAIFLSTLNANVFKFDTIRAVQYRLSGSCDAFWQQLGSNCETITRAQWRDSLPTEG